jgi:hypothetical protein
MNLTTFVLIMVQLVPMVLELTQKAEKVYKGLQQGVLKKNYVMDGIQQGFNIGAYFDKDLARYMGYVLNIADKLIDVFVYAANITGVFETSQRIDTRPKGGN